MTRENNWKHIDDLMRRKALADEQEQRGQTECKKLRNDAQSKSNAIYEKVAALQKESSEIMNAAYKQIEYIEYNLRSCRESIEREREVVMRAITKSSLKEIEPSAFEHHERSVFKYRVSLTPDAKWMQVFATIYANNNTVNKYTLAAEIIPNGVSPDTIIKLAGYLSTSGTRTGIRELGKFSTIDRAKTHITKHAREKADSFVATVAEFDEEMQAAEPFTDIFDFRLVDGKFNATATDDRNHDYERAKTVDRYMVIEKSAASLTIDRSRWIRGVGDDDKKVRLIVGLTRNGLIVEGGDPVDAYRIINTIRSYYELPHLQPIVETLAKKADEYEREA